MAGPVPGGVTGGGYIVGRLGCLEEVGGEDEIGIDDGLEGECLGGWLGGDDVESLKLKGMGEGVWVCRPAHNGPQDR